MANLTSKAIEHVVAELLDESGEIEALLEEFDTSAIMVTPRISRLNESYPGSGDGLLLEVEVDSGDEDVVVHKFEIAIKKISENVRGY
jgi:hypothetical protein